MNYLKKQYLSTLTILLISITSSFSQVVVNIDTKLKSVDRLKFISDDTYQLAYFGNDEYSEIILFKHNQPIDTINYTFYSQVENKKSLFVDFYQNEEYFFAYILDTQIFGDQINVMLLKYSKKDMHYKELKIGSYNGPLKIISTFKDERGIQMVQINNKSNFIYFDNFFEDRFERISIPFDGNFDFSHLEKNNFKYMATNHSFINGYSDHQVFIDNDSYIFLLANTKESKDKILFYSLSLKEKNIKLFESEFTCNDCAVTYRDGNFISIQMVSKKLEFNVYDFNLNQKISHKYDIDKIDFLSRPLFEDGKPRLDWQNNDRNTKASFKYLRKGTIICGIYDYSADYFGITLGGFYYPQTYYGNAVGTTGFATSPNKIVYSTTFYSNKLNYELENNSNDLDIMEKIVAFTQGYQRKNYDYIIDSNMCEILLFEKKELKSIRFDKKSK